MKLTIFAIGVLCLFSLSFAREMADSPYLGIMAASLDTMNDFALMSFDGNGKTKMITNLTTVGGILPMESAYIAHLDAVAFVSIGSGSFVTLVRSDGKMLGHWAFNSVVLTNIEYDIPLKLIYLTGYVPAEKQNYLWQLQEDGTLTKVLPLPGIVQIGKSTYCQKGHEFFATIRTDEGSGNALIIIHTQSKKVSKPIPLDDTVLMLFHDYPGDVMYAIFATRGQAAVLVEFDPHTGKRVKDIAAFSDLSANPGSGASAALNYKTKVITGAFVKIGGDLTPYWVTLDTQTGKTTSVEYPYGYPINLLYTLEQ